MAKKKSRLTQALAAAQAEKSKVAHAQRVTTAKEAVREQQKQKQKQTQKQKQLPKPPGTFSLIKATKAVTKSISSPNVVAAIGPDACETLEPPEHPATQLQPSGADHSCDKSGRESERDSRKAGKKSPAKQVAKRDTASEDASAERNDLHTPSDKGHPLHEPENSPTIRSESKLAPKTKKTPATTSPSHKPPKLKAQIPSSSVSHQTMCQDSAEKRSKPNAKKMAAAQPPFAKKDQFSPNPSNTKGQSPSIEDAVLKTSAKEKIVTLQAKVATPLPSFSKRPPSDHDSEEVEENVSGEGTTRRPICMVGPHDHVLLIGEGNFSFAASLVLYHSHPGHLLTATTNDSEETISQKYPDAAEFIKALKAQKVNVLFELDGCNLHKDKRVKNSKFDRVVFNFPHTGAREADMDRNIKSNQILILRFLKSVGHILRQPSRNDDHYAKLFSQPASKRHKKRQKCGTKKTYSSDSEIDHETNYPPPSKLDQDNFDDDGLVENKFSLDRQSNTPGTVLITVRNCSPYTLWNIPMLAKRGPTLAHSILYPTHPSLNNPKSPQPAYSVVRSSGFFPTDYPGYEHRRTNGFQPGRSTHACLDILLPASSRSSQNLLLPSEEEEAKARTWELALVTQ